MLYIKNIWVRHTRNFEYNLIYFLFFYKISNMRPCPNVNKVIRIYLEADGILGVSCLQKVKNEERLNQWRKYHAVYATILLWALLHFASVFSVNKYLTLPFFMQGRKTNLCNLLYCACLIDNPFDCHKRKGLKEWS